MHAPVEVDGDDSAGETPITDILAGEAPRPLKLRLEVVAGPDAGAVLELTQGTYFVGKGSGCDLSLSDAAVSRRHLEIAVLADGARVRDLESTNGSYLGTTRFEVLQVGPGTVLRIGHTEMRVSGGEPSTPPVGGRPALERFGPLESCVQAVRQTFAVLERAARSESVVLVQGETGTGKEVVAEALHAASPRARGPFVVCDLGSLPRSLIESELFGHVRGAFTGAERDRRGAFAEAHGGTLFLDEIGELELEAQPRLLRALERRQYKPVGATAYQTSDVRVIAATNRDLAAEVRAGRFREDLFHRLAVVRVQLLPLRERRDDIPRLVVEFLTQAAPAHRAPPMVPGETMALLRAHYWPGNVRELRNVLERALSLAPDSDVLDAHLLGLDEPSARADISSPPVDITFPFKEAKDRLVQAWEREYVIALLAKCAGNVSLAARSGGLDRVYLHRLIKKHGLAAG